ncbi:MAG: hypothetical protein HY748_13265 [Elusimicrobia bacterium]|nr:hypothetical protein [Elusimicrobiota bacterium]
MQRTVVSVIIGNLALFVLVTSSAMFQDIHHHWIFPVLAAFFIAQWALAGGLVPWRGPLGWFDPAWARPTILSLLGFLMLMGIVRHWSILHCIGRCSLKLGEAAVLAAAAFWGQARLNDPLWGPFRAKTACMACLLWAAWLFLFGFGVKPGWLDAGYLVLAALLLAGWKRPPLRFCGLGIPVLVLVRWSGADLAVILLSVPVVLAFFWLAGRS